MALVYADRVKETTVTTGTGTVDLAGAATGFQGFVAGIGDGNTCVYCIEDGTDWEVGIGTVTDAATDTLSRDEVFSSSNSDALVDFGTRTKDVRNVWSEKMLRSTSSGITASTSQTQAEATALTAYINEVSTCANTNDAVRLPAALAGLEVIVINNGAQTLQVFPESGDNLGAGVDSSTTIFSTAFKKFAAYDAANWKDVT